MSIQKSFLTEEFYLNPCTALNALNDLVTQDLVEDMDMYSEGEFLTMEVFDNEKSREILSTCISDFDKYIKYNNDGFASDETTEIGLSGLHYLHDNHFKNKDEIVWNVNKMRFYFIDNNN